MLQVALIAFMAAGAFLPMTYFDLSYQLMAVCALLGLHVQEGGAQPTGERSHGLGVGVRSPPVHSALAE